MYSSLLAIQCSNQIGFTLYNIYTGLLPCMVAFKFGSRKSDYEFPI